MTRLIAGTEEWLCRVGASPGEHKHGLGQGDFASYRWIRVNDNASWSPRAGLQVVELANRFYLMGGRTPNPPSFPPVPGDSTIWADVWASDDHGRSWSRILENADAAGYWPARAYFQAVGHRGRIFVFGGQNFDTLPNPGPCPPP